MIHDVNLSPDAPFERRFDVCIVGSGPAGITLARKLAERGLDVALLEGGGLDFSDESQELYTGAIVGLGYHDTDVTRLRYFGGTSNHWGGRSRPLDAHDFRARPYHDLSGWPISKADLDPHAAAADAVLDLPPVDVVPDRPVEGAEEDLSEIRFRHSPPTRFNGKYHDALAASERIHLVLNANLVDLRLNEAGNRVLDASFRSYRAEAPAFQVRARAYCLCLGGLENPRALLNMQSQIPQGIGNQHDLVGRFFCEHPAYRIGEVLFEDMVPESQGYAPTAESMARGEFLNFNLLMQTRGMSFFTEAGRSLACSGEFFARLAERVLGRPFDCGVGGLGRYRAARLSDDYRTGTLGLIVEQALNPESRVLLGADRDRFGLRRLALDWRLSPLDLHTMRSAATVFGQYVAARRIGRVRMADWLIAEDPQPPALGMSDSEVGLHHHMCTTRMSDNPREGVVDRDCRVHGCDNLYMGGSSVFATVGHANPTYTIVQLALRLGDHLAGALV